MNPSALIASSARLSHEMLTIVHAEPPTLDALAAALADVAAGALPSHDVAVTILVDRSRAARAATARPARELSALETRLGEGPTRRALDEARTVETGIGPDTGTGAVAAGAWADAVAATDYRRVLAVPIVAAGAATGAITLYGRTARGDGHDREVAELVAHQAALVVEGGRRLVQLRDAVSSRDVIGQAEGILMHRFGIDAATAFRRLVEASQDMNVKLVDIARWYVTGPGRPGAGRAAVVSAVPGVPSGGGGGPGGREVCTGQDLHPPTARAVGPVRRRSTRRPRPANVGPIDAELPVGATPTSG